MGSYECELIYKRLKAYIKDPIEELKLVTIELQKIKADIDTKISLLQNEIIRSKAWEKDILIHEDPWTEVKDLIEELKSSELNLIDSKIEEAIESMPKRRKK